MSMDFQVLTSIGEDRERWSRFVNGLKREDRDIHFLPEYYDIYTKTYGYQPYLATYGNEESYVIQPFVERRLNDLPFLHEHRNETYIDIANAYGYGGPVCLCDSESQGKALFQDFDPRFKEYCLRKRIASEFVSLHPLLGNRKYIPDDSTLRPCRQKEVVFLDLSLSTDEIWLEINRGHRSSINKARKNGVRIEKVEPTAENLETFKKLYYQTMKRTRAAEKWYFPQEYFSHCFECLGKDRASLFLAFVDDMPASAYLVLHAFSTAYYHFGGSDEQYYEHRPNNLLMFETALWAKRAGFSRYHLGGGVTSSPEDSLFRFKSGFSKSAATLYTYQRVHDEEIYNYLCQLKKQYEVSINDENQSDYFPLYRR